MNQNHNTPCDVIEFRIVRSDGTVEDAVSCVRYDSDMIKYCDSEGGLRDFCARYVTAVLGSLFDSVPARKPVDEQNETKLPRRPSEGSGYNEVLREIQRG